MRKGFTLIELIVVIAIIAVLAAIIAPNAFRAIEKAKISATLSDFRSMKTGAMSFYADTGDWPPDGTDGSDALLIDDDGTGSTIPGWDGPYLEQWPDNNRWSGVYLWVDGNTMNWDSTAGNDEARHIQLTLIPSAATERIDTALDGAASVAANRYTRGSIRSNATFVGNPPVTACGGDQCTVQLLVSTGVAVAN